MKVICLSVMKDFSEGTAWDLGLGGRSSSDETGYRHALLEQAGIFVVAGPRQSHADLQTRYRASNSARGAQRFHNINLSTARR
jgi:hypothetical protein